MANIRCEYIYAIFALQIAVYGQSIRLLPGKAIMSLFNRKYIEKASWGDIDGMGALNLLPDQIVGKEHEKGYTL